MIQGIVQGVGFRPFVYDLARRFALAGYVRNQQGSVLVEVEGETVTLDRFIDALAKQVPALARIESLSIEPRPPCGDVAFHIEHSERHEQGPVFLSPDVAICVDCLAELNDPRDRRYQHPFLNCTNCGPRLTIITGSPYDRERTSMAEFVMCPACRAEYENPSDRRFHAQPTCCPACGPQLQLLDVNGQPLPGGDPTARFAQALRTGAIGALKGLGGYHLTCDARLAAAVAELRRRKQRDEKPFAIMAAHVPAVEALCCLSPAERELLTAPQRPIVLLKKRPGAAVAAETAPNNPFLGVMLPYTPLHHLLMHAVDDMPLVMTSGNRSDEPIAHDDADAVKRLADIADVFLVHNRAIQIRCDDSITRIVAGSELPIRRSRGYAPAPIRLPFECPRPILAVGGQLKSTFALGRGKHAVVSHHLGDLDHYDAYRAFLRDIALYEGLFEITPEIVVHDLHPDYASTRYALSRSLPLIGVQHHHAHIASCLAEHRLDEPVIGVAFDGTGFGPDGTIWGGEFLIADYQRCHRAAHLRPVNMPGGDKAIKQPWRMAMAYLHDAGLRDHLLSRWQTQAELRVVQQMLERRFNAPLTSSVGRLFDAVAALVGIRQHVTYEGQAAAELEWLAGSVAPNGAYPVVFEQVNDVWHIDTRPIIRAVAAEVAQGVTPALIARRFHSTMTDMIAAACSRLRKATELNVVVLSGGVFLNALLLEDVTNRLEEAGFRVFRQRLVPPNDGGLSLGQLAIGAALM